MRPFALALLAFLLMPSSPLRAQREMFSFDDLDYIQKTWPGAKRTNTGIFYVIQREGRGNAPEPGNLVSVLYTGTLLNGALFDMMNDPAHPFTFRVGRHFVIEGWDQVLKLMKPGEKRLVIIPPELAYGSIGHPPRIPRDASLVFTMELLKVEGEK